MTGEELDMTEMDAITVRHSVRQYIDKPLTAEAVSALTDEIAVCNREGGLHIQLVVNEPKAFDGFMARYGKFSGVKNYIALIGKKGPALDELCGYYGERLVLLAQQMGLNTCWVGLTYSKVKAAYTVASGEKLCAAIALGYGQTQGVPHKSKAMTEVAKVFESTPEWFQNGMEAVLLAPTAMNQQKFVFTLADGKVQAQAGSGFYTKMDLGIAKYHFEIGAGKENFQWA